jgi:hypothetical protein
MRTRWFRILAVVCLGLAVMEVASRAFVRVWAGKPFRSLSFYIWSPYGLVRNNPQLTSPAFAINANGFRNTKTYAREKTPGTFRVLLLGGSVLYSGLGGRAFLQNQGRVGSDATIAQYLEEILKQDPAFAGLRLEVINAAVNFSRIGEVSSSYLAEYIFWDPDVVIVCGSANNFHARWPAGSQVGQRNAVQENHAWRSEFERLVNEKTLASWAEVSVRIIEEHIASVALGRRAVAVALDRLVAVSGNHSIRGESKAGERTFAEPAAIDDLRRDYLGHADAMIAAARAHDQVIAFFWEYFVGHLGGIKPFSNDERFLYRLERAESDKDVQFNFLTRDKLRDHMDSLGVPFIDPLPELRLFRGTAFIDYLHYTKEGNRLMAAVMYERLRRHLHERAQRIKTEAEAR